MEGTPSQRVPAVSHAGGTDCKAMTSAHSVPPPGMAGLEGTWAPEWDSGQREARIGRWGHQVHFIFLRFAFFLKKIKGPIYIKKLPHRV